MPLLPDTRYSLLGRLADPADAAAWSEFVEIYETAIYRYSRSHGLQDADAREVVQHVLLAVHRVIGNWNPSGRPGSFRAWLVRTAHRLCLRALRDLSKCDRAVGGTSVVRRLHDVTDPGSSLRDDDFDWNRWAFCWAAGQIQREIEARTWQAFWWSAVEGLPPADVARRLGLKIGSVYAAKCRVLARIRDRVQELSRSER